MIEDMDQDIGKLLAKIEEQGLTQNTLVIFASDHGAMLPGSNAPWRDFKGTLFEGGIRVPLLARHPGSLPAGVENAQVTALFDLTHSFLRLAGASPEDLAELDGIDILKRAQEEAPPTDRSLAWRARRGDLSGRSVALAGGAVVHTFDRSRDR